MRQGCYAGWGMGKMNILRGWFCMTRSWLSFDNRLTLSGTGRLLQPAVVTAASGTPNGTAGGDANGWGDDELAAEIYGQ